MSKTDLTQRYRVLDDASHSCCNAATVVDMSIGVNPRTGDYHVEAQLCECKDRKHAELIAAALNRMTAQ